MINNVFNCFWNKQGIGAFFRDLSTPTLKEEVVEQLQKNIPILLCNLEKIFPPEFFDVMEHLAVHIPYQYERAMKYLKGKAKNLVKVEGSIIAGSLTEETSLHIVLLCVKSTYPKKSSMKI